MLRKYLKLNKNTILLLSSLFISSFILIVGYEIFENIRYYRWKSIYRVKGDSCGNLTILSSNKELMWEYKPYGEARSIKKEHEGYNVGIIKTNRYGFRDYDYDSEDKPAGTYRIAFIGDSATLGIWVDYEKIFVRKFEVEGNKLNLHKKLQALNFSIDGYNIIQIYEMLKTKVLGFSPDKVVYILCLNDFDFDVSSGFKVYYFKKPKSFLIKRIKKAFNRFRLDSEDYHIYYYNKNDKVVFSKIIEMKNLLQQIKVSFQVVLLPSFYTDQKEFRNYPLSHMHNEIKKFLKKNNINVFDLLEVFKKQNKPPKFYAYDIWHPNEQGHRLIAHALLHPLLREYSDTK